MHLDTSVSNEIKGTQETSTLPEWGRKACVELPDMANAEDRSGAMHAVFTSQDKLWALPTDGSPFIMNYYFMGGSANQRRKVNTIIKEYEVYCNVVFRESVTPTGSHLRITFDANNGSWCYVSDAS